MAHTIETVVAKTTKGHRIWLQGLGQHGWTGGTTFSVQWTQDSIVFTKSTAGKVRKVTAGKHGGVIDTEGKRVTKWAQGHTAVSVLVGNQSIVITRA